MVDDIWNNIKSSVKQQTINSLGFCGNLPVCFPQRQFCGQKILSPADLKHTTTHLRLLYLLSA